MSKIVTNLLQLSNITEKVDTIEEAKNIADMLFEELASHGNGVGLAANQIGINKQVCVIHVPYRKPLWFMNPRYRGGYEYIEFDEGCLSFPEQTVRTRRYKTIVVSADNLDKEMIFSTEDYPLECVCIQHEIDHLNGETMFAKAVQGTDI